MQTRLEQIEADVQMCIQVMTKVHKLADQCFQAMTTGMAQTCKEAQGTPYETYLNQFMSYSLQVYANNLRVFTELTVNHLGAYLHAVALETAAPSHEQACKEGGEQ
jgi:hypothetical protein